MLGIRYDDRVVNVVQGAIVGRFHVLGCPTLYVFTLRVYLKEFVLEKRLGAKDGCWSRHDLRPDRSGEGRLGNDHQVCRIGGLQHLICWSVVSDSCNLVPHLELDTVFNSDVADAGARDDTSILISTSHENVLAAGLEIEWARLLSGLLRRLLSVHQRGEQKKRHSSDCFH